MNPTRRAFLKAAVGGMSAGCLGKVASSITMGVDPAAGAVTPKPQIDSPIELMEQLWPDVHFYDSQKEVIRVCFPQVYDQNGDRWYPG